jgi:hypothetical protein
LTFRATWKGIADFDNVAPTINLLRASATKLRRPSGAYLVRVAFSARDNAQDNTIAYSVSAYWTGASQLVVKKGQIRSGSASVALRVRPATRVRRLQLKILASDPLGNERRLSRVVRLPS